MRFWGPEGPEEGGGRAEGGRGGAEGRAEGGRRRPRPRPAVPGVRPQHQMEYASNPSLRFAIKENQRERRKPERKKKTEEKEENRRERERRRGRRKKKCKKVSDLSGTRTRVSSDLNAAGSPRRPCFSAMVYWQGGILPLDQQVSGILISPGAPLRGAPFFSCFWWSTPTYMYRIDTRSYF